LKEQGRQSYTVTCISCGNETLTVNEVYYDIPRFGTMALISMLCSTCGYRVFDTVPLDFSGPSKIEFKVRTPKDLSAKVIRSTTASLSVPELGLELNPGPRSEAFITNIEGLLDRFVGIAEQLICSAEPESIESGFSREGAQDTIERIKLAMDGKLPFTVIIEDEAGNSAIIPENGAEPSTEATGAPKEK